VPKTLLGKWSVGLIIIFFLLFAAFIFLVASGQEDGLFTNLTFAIAGGAAVLAFFAGIIGIIRSKERSVLVFLATAIGFLAITGDLLTHLLFALGEILFPY